jgi:TonB family protein
MVLEALAAAAVAAASPAQPAPTPVSPLSVRALPKGKHPPVAVTVEVPDDETAAGGVWASVWPEDAYKDRINGHVVLRCNVDRYGLAETCEVAQESPEGKGFGEAALELRPTLKLKPALGPDGPIDAVMNIAIAFNAPDPQFIVLDTPGGQVANCGQLNPPCPEWHVVGNPLPIRPETMLNNPVWTKTASFEELMSAYPAKAGSVDGYVVTHCHVEAGGDLSGCRVIKEDPEKRGFRDGALALAAKFKVSPEWTKAPRNADLWVDIPFRFSPPGSVQDRTIKSPYWLAGFDPDQALKVYPPEAAAQGVNTGHGIAKCVVARDGTLTDCSAVEANPEGLGFSEAVVKLASTMRMNPWSRDGTPVDGGTVVLGVTLNLKAQH